MPPERLPPEILPKPPKPPPIQRKRPRPEPAEPEPEVPEVQSVPSEVPLIQHAPLASSDSDTEEQTAEAKALQKKAHAEAANAVNELFRVPLTCS